ncbi:hypothetical protein KCU65_g2572, partial [Aureobasidium melanogenum]
MSYVMPPDLLSQHDVALPREDTKSGITQESTVFNKPEDSDIIIEHHGIKIHAHRAILRMCSPFFDRILQSQWPVAKGPVFSLGDDDDPIVVDGMLHHMYNLPYTDSLKSDDRDELFKLHVETFFLADKYDCPSLRRAAVSNFHDAATKALDSGMLPLLNNTIATLCGPDARQTADVSLRTATLDFCATNYNKLFEWALFRKQFKKGNLFDVDAANKLLEQIGTLALKKRADEGRRYGLLAPRKRYAGGVDPDRLDFIDLDDLDNLPEPSSRERANEGCRSS